MALGSGPRGYCNGKFTGKCGVSMFDSFMAMESQLSRGARSCLFTKENIAEMVRALAMGNVQ